MKPEWSIIIGIGLASLLREVYLTSKSILHKSEKSSKKFPSIISIVIGCMIIVPFIGAVGLAIAVYAYRRTKNAGLSIAGIIINSISILFWASVAIFGP